MKAVLLALMRGYQYAFRPLLGANCRFYPSCSDYAREAIEKHGALKGGWLAAQARPALSPVSSGRLRPGSLNPFQPCSSRAPCGARSPRLSWIPNA